MSNKNELLLMVRLRGAEWGGISNKLRGMTTCVHETGLVEWLYDQAEVADSRSLEAYAIAKEIESSDTSNFGHH